MPILKTHFWLCVLSGLITILIAVAELWRNLIDVHFYKIEDIEYYVSAALLLFLIILHIILLQWNNLMSHSKETNAYMSIIVIGFSMIVFGIFFAIQASLSAFPNLSIFPNCFLIERDSIEMPLEHKIETFLFYTISCQVLILISIIVISTIIESKIHNEPIF